MGTSVTYWCHNKHLSKQFVRPNKPRPPHITLQFSELFIATLPNFLIPSFRKQLASQKSLSEPPHFSQPIGRQAHLSTVSASWERGCKTSFRCFFFFFCTTSQRHHLMDSWNKNLKSTKYWVYLINIHSVIDFNITKCPLQRMMQTHQGLKEGGTSLLGKHH